MIERLEVTPGPGTVIRYGSVAAWAASSASPGLVSFLAVSARNLSDSASGGRQLADHLVGVLEARDPEPNVPFAVIGPTEDGWAALLHGPVQIWDGTSWITPSPNPGWLRCSVWPQPSLAVTFAGASAPPVSPDSLWDLEAGVVPGSGFVLLPAVRTPTRILGAVGVESPGPPDRSRGANGEGGTGSSGSAGSGAGPATAATSDSPAGPPAADVTVAAGAGADRAGADQAGAERTAADGTVAEGTSSAAPVPEGAASGTGSGPEVTAADPEGVVDLRSPSVRARVVAYPPLPAGPGPGRPVPGSPVVAGVLCRQGHLNRPGMTACVRCSSTITDQDAYNVSGTRPALGCLVMDDGSVYRLDTGYLVGSEPGRDPTVRGGLARPLALGGDQVAASHAEIRLHDWDVVVTDRDSPGGTYLYGPESNAWERLRAYEPRVLQPGTHMAFGQRVATFLTPWITGPRPGPLSAAGEGGPVESDTTPGRSPTAGGGAGPQAGDAEPDGPVTRPG